MTRPARAVHPAAGERRPRRRPLAGAARRAAAAASGSRSIGRARCRRRHFRAADLAAATHDVRARPAAGDDHPPRRRPSRPRHRELRPGHAAGVPRRPGHVPLVVDDRAARRALSMPIDVDAGGPRVPPPQRPAQLRRPDPRQRGTRAPVSRLGARCRAGRTRTSSPRRSTASPTDSATRSRSSTRPPGPATTGCRRSSSSSPTARRCVELACSGPSAEPPASRRSRACPSTYVEADDEADTLEIDLADGPSGLVVTLVYTIFRDLPIVARSARIRNGGSGTLRLQTAMSASIDLPDAGWDLVHLSGMWGRERMVRTRRLELGRQSVSSARGASSHQQNPFLALRRPATTEADGEAIGLALVYSGNFLAEAEVEPFGTARARIGIDPETFGWTLAPGDEFATPEAVIGWSSDGLGALSDAFHRLFRERLARGTWRDRPRPVKVNNWEGTYFDFDADRLLAMATVAQRARDRAVRPRRRLVREARRRHDLARRLVRRPPQAARRHRRAGPRDRGARPEVRPVDRAGDGQRAQPAVRGPPGLGDRRARPEADREPPAARPRHGPARGRRPSRSACYRTSSAARRSRTSSGT